MRTISGVIIGVALAFLGGAGESRAQVCLVPPQRQAEEMAERRIDELRARVRCAEEHATARQALRGTAAANHASPEARGDRDAQLAEADQRYRDCLGELEVLLLRQACLSVARTEAQRARCYQ